jgi:hypothetical protein
MSGFDDYLGWDSSLGDQVLPSYLKEKVESGVEVDFFSSNIYEEEPNKALPSLWSQSFTEDNSKQEPSSKPLPPLEYLLNEDSHNSSKGNSEGARQKSSSKILSYVCEVRHLRR